MLEKLNLTLDKNLSDLKIGGRLKGPEKIIVDILPPLNGYGKKIKMSDGASLINFASNNYLGISTDQRLVEAEHEASLKFGVGPGAVRFISGTQEPHIKLENYLSGVFGKEAAMIFNSAYAANCGVIAPLISEDTVIISDELNHNSIISAIRLAGVPKEKKMIYRHCDMSELRKCISCSIGKATRLIIVTDGVFSMRGNHASLNDIVSLSKEYGPRFAEGIITIVDDSHGVGAFGKTGRGTVEVCNAYEVDIITGTLGKALGVDGGFIVSGQKIIEYLRETSASYIYSNPISSGIANAALKALEILDSKEGLDLLAILKRNTEHFRKGIEKIGFETIDGIHPIVSLLIGDPARSRRIAAELYKKGIFVIALTYPVVPKGQDSIRVQISGSHTTNDIDYALNAFEETLAKEAKRDIDNKHKFNPIGTGYKSILPEYKVTKNLPEKMDAWVTYRGGKTLLEKIPLPDMLPDDVLIESLWISICSSDVNKFVDLVPGLDKTVFGHEFAGRIVAAGKNIDESIIGKIAVVEEHYPCLCCEFCKKGRYDMCQKEGFLGWYKSGNPDDWIRNGSFAEYVSIHHSCAKITEGIETMDFFPSLAEAFGNTVKMETKIEEICGHIPDTLVIWGGCGNQALYMVPYLAKKGVKNFILVDSDEAAILYMKKHLHDLEINLFFLKSGSHEELIFLKKKLKQEDGFITLELTAENSLQELVLKYASPNGKVFYYGLPKNHEKVFIPGTEVDLYSFITGKAGIEKIDLNGVLCIRVMGRDNQSWGKTIEAIKSDEKLRKFIIDPLVIAGTTDNIGELIEYLIINGSRYEQDPYGKRPAKFAVISKKMLNNKSENYG